MRNLKVQKTVICPSSLTSIITEIMLGPITPSGIFTLGKTTLSYTMELIGKEIKENRAQMHQNSHLPVTFYLHITTETMQVSKGIFALVEDHMFLHQKAKW